MTKTQGVSLASLSASTSAAFEFEYVTPAGKHTGIFFQVLSGQSETVTAEINKLVNQRRQAEAAQAALGGRDARTAFTPVEDDVAFGQRLAAVRLVGWRGIEEEFSPERALQLCQSNADIAAQITEKSSNVGNFMRL